MKLVGYADKLSVPAGGEVSFMVSSEFPTFNAEVVRLIHGDDRPQSPGFKSEPVDSELSGEHPGIKQRIWPGSYVRIRDHKSLRSGGEFSIHLWMLSTTPAKQGQTIVSKTSSEGTGIAMRIEDGHLVLAIDDQTVRSTTPVVPNVWYFVAASVSATQKSARIFLEQVSGVVIAAAETVTAEITPLAESVVGDVLFAAELSDSSGTVNHFFNGKIDAPRLYDRCLSHVELEAARRGQDAAEPVGAWDFSLDISTSRISDTSSHANHGVAVNRPTRAVTGHNWDHTVMAWPEAPNQYGAIHFHDDDLSDAGWKPSCHWTVPCDLRSGLYALHVSNGDDEDYIPFIVAEPLGRSKADVLVVLPTFSYLAYGDEQMPNGGTLAGLVMDYPRQPEDSYIVDNHLISLYDKHTDASSVCYASWLRPLVNMRPKYTQHYLNAGKGAPHQLPADLHLIDWLTQSGFTFDVISDFELHSDGLERLQPYRVVLTGTHAEYASGAMIDAYQGFLNGGGRLMQMGGNSMFWVTELDPDTRTGVEIRRRAAPAWTWPVGPGEAHLSSTGELGCHWANRGRSAHEWIGVNTGSEGYSDGRPFRRTSASHDPRVAFVFDGIGEDELIGDIPNLVSGWGAAGFELDWSEPRLTPAHTLVVATADDFSDDFEILPHAMAGGPEQHPKPQSDLVFLEYPLGGAVFSFSSIAWCGSLSYNDYENNVSRLTRNVLDGFLAEGSPPWLRVA